MAFEQKDMSGSLFRNDKKETDNHPDYKGSAVINGTEFWLDSWINTSKDGTKYMAVKFKPKEARADAGARTYAATRDLDDETPF